MTDLYPFVRWSVCLVALVYVGFFVAPGFLDLRDRLIREDGQPIYLHGELNTSRVVTFQKSCDCPGRRQVQRD